MLKVSDVEWCLPRLNFMNLDDFTLKAIEDRNRATLERRVNNVNNKWREWKQYWPQGTIYNFFVGLFLKQDNQYEFIRSLNNEQFKHEIIQTCNQNPYISGSASLKHDSTSISPLVDLSPEDRKHNQQVEMPDITKWNKSYITKISNLFRKFWETDAPEDVVDFFYKKTGFNLEQCRYVYDQLLQKGYIGGKLKKQAQKGAQMKITGFTFVKNAKEFRVGKTRLGIADPDLNPLKGYNDPLTGEPFTKPLMCENFYVLDERTWCKQINEHQQHPYTREHLGSIRKLIELTPQNFAEYKDKIVNLPELSDSN